jgi:Tc5 transposase DNA-binding domain
MTRKSRPDLASKEAQMQSALKSWKANKKQSIARLAKTCDVCHTTLNNRIKGRKSRREGRQRLQALSPAEENELIKWISKLTVTGFSPQKLIRQMAETIHNRRTKGINDESIRLIQYPSLGKHWVRNFIRRHPRLKIVVGQTIEASRIDGTRPEVLKKWFDAYQTEIIEDPNVQTENMYNADESSFSIGAIKAGRVVIDKELRTRFHAQPG